MGRPLKGYLVGVRLFEWLEHTEQQSTAVAEEVRLSPTTVSNLLNGHIDHPRLRTVRKLARHFGVSVEEFLEGPKVQASARVVESLRALPFEARTELFEALVEVDPKEPWWPGQSDRLIRAIENLAVTDEPLAMTTDEFFDFLIHASAEEARLVLFAGAETEEQRRRAGAAFVSAVAWLIRQGRITGTDVAERLAVAGQLQTGAA